MRADRGRGGLGLGWPSFLLMLGLLTLAAFALLTFSAASSQLRLSRSAAEAAQAWYAADTQAELALAQVRDSAAQGGRPESVGAQVPVAWQQAEGGWLASFSLPLQETRELQVTVLIQEGGFTILRWQGVYIAPWQAGDRLPVFQGP